MDRFFFDRILNLIFPPKCGFCGEVTGTNSFICMDCWATKKHEYINRCEFCGKTSYNGICAECKSQKRYYDKLLFWSEYSDEIRDKIHAYKFSGKKFYYNFFSELLIRKLEGMTADMIIPVPISRERRKEREYNQSELIAKKISQVFNIPYYSNILIKTKDVERQSLLNSKKRKESVKNVFEIADILRVSGKLVILIDDIFTTGATANECSKVLKRAGVKEIKVAVICISHTLK